MKLIEEITQKDDKAAYQRVKEIIDECEVSNKYYKYMDDFVTLLNDEKSYIRTRAFMLICANAKWDKNNIIDKHLSSLICLYHDEKPTVVRQCLKSTKTLLTYKKELISNIKKELKRINLSIFKDSMAPLIKKDIDEILNVR